MKPTIKIGIAEDHELVRQGFIRMLNDYIDLDVIFEVGNGKELLSCLADHKPDIVLLDIAMPVMDGIVVMEKIKIRYPKIKVIVISSNTEISSIIGYVKLGANSFLPKNCKIEQLLKAIYSVYEDSNYFEESILKMLVKTGVPPNGYIIERKLTEKEISILKLLCKNVPYSIIAKKNGITEKTVDWYRHKLILKTNTVNLEGLTDYAKNNGLA